jgi:hypothetical protein
MLNLKIYLCNPFTEAVTTETHRAVTLDLLKGHIGYLERLNPVNARLMDWVLVARHKDDPTYFTFYNVDASPEHGRHAFGNDYSRAYRFSTKEVPQIFRVLKDLNEAPPRHVGDSRYPIQALSEAFGLSYEDLQKHKAYFQLVQFKLALD